MPVMQQETIEVVDVQTRIILDENVELQFDINSSNIISVGNTREGTKVAFPDAVADFRTESVLLDLYREKQSVNAKHFIVTENARDYLDLLNSDQTPNYTNEKVKNTSLYFCELETISSNDAAVEIRCVDPSDKKTCHDLSQFQQNNLKWFRQLSNEVELNKVKERYDEAAFNYRVSSPGIYVYYLKIGKEILATLTLNLHQTDPSVSSYKQSCSFGYLSDLFVTEGLHLSKDFISSFIKSTFANIKMQFPKLKTVSVMAGTNDKTKPILMCFDHAKNAKLIYPFTRDEQARLGVVAQFTYEPEKNKDHVHAKMTKAEESYSTLSLFANNTFQFTSSTENDLRNRNSIR